MSNAEIIGNIGEAEYKINIDKTSAALAQRITRLNDIIAQLNNDLADANDKLSDIASQRIALLDELDQLIVESGYDNREKIQELQNEIRLKEVEYNQTALDINRIKASLLRAETSRARLISVKDEEKTVFCADYSTELSGLKGIHPLSGKAEKVVIAPGGSETNGFLVPGIEMTSREAILNYVIDPARRKWKPTTRSGLIAELDQEKGTAKIILDNTTADEFDLNVKNEFIDVPVDYMECGSLAFLEGDHVVVKFNENTWENPEIIGFTANPRECPMFFEISMTAFEMQEEFISLANLRMAELEEMINFTSRAQQYAERLINYYESLIGKCRAMLPWGGVGYFCAEFHTEQYWRPVIKDWEHFKNDVAPAFKENLGINKDKWSSVKNMVFENIELGEFFYDFDRGSDFSWTPTENAWFSPNDWFSHKEGNIILRAQKIDAVPLPPTIPANSTFTNAEKIRSDYGKWLYEQRNERDEFYYYKLGFKNENSSLGIKLFQFDFLARPFYSNADKQFFLATKNWQFEAFETPKGGLETADIKVAMGGETVFSYPPNADYLINSVEMTDKREVPVDMSINLSGRLQRIPKYFGSDAILQYKNVFDQGGPVFDPDEEFESFLAYIWRADRHYFIPRGFEFFAGKYPDHPIITGEDIFETKSNCPFSEIEEVHSYVNNNFAAVREEDDNDLWVIMDEYGRTYGDCEDFALTKIDMLLRRGWPISRMKICCGTKIEYDQLLGKITDTTAHAWAVIDDTWALDVNRASVVPREELEAEWSYNTSCQISGLKWECKDSFNYGTTSRATAVPWEYDDINKMICRISATVERRTENDKLKHG